MASSSMRCCCSLPTLSFSPYTSSPSSSSSAFASPLPRPPSSGIARKGSSPSLQIGFRAHSQQQQWQGHNEDMGVNRQSVSATQFASSLPHIARRGSSLVIQSAIRAQQQQQQQQQGLDEEDIVGENIQPTSSDKSHGDGNESLILLAGGVKRSRRDVFGLGAAAAVGLGSMAVGATATPDESIAAGQCAQLTTTSSGLAFCDVAVGSGIPASKGLLIKAHYTGKLESGKVFDSSYNRGKPLTFRIGVGEVIRGWDQGILGADGIPPMLAGGKRTLRIPSQLGYGERGAGCRGGSCLIPPNSVLLFDVEFVGKA